MSAVFSINDNFHLKLVQNVQDGTIESLEHLLSVINNLRTEISFKIHALEKQASLSSSTETLIAVLIRQDQYLEALQNAPKYKLSELFVFNKEKTCETKVLHWYKN